MAENLILCSFLGICSCYDLKLRKIPGWLLYTGILLGTLYWGILKMAGQVSWAALPVSLLPGGVILFYSYITEGKIGIGDGLLVCRQGLCSNGRDVRRKLSAPVCSPSFWRRDY